MPDLVNLRGDDKYPARSTKSVDISGIWLFGVPVLFLGFVSVYLFQNCMPSRFYRGTDSWGNVCGGDSNTRTLISNLPGSGQLKRESTYLYLMQLQPTFNLSATYDFNMCYEQALSINVEEAVKLCVKECPLQDTKRYNNTDCFSILRTNSYDERHVAADKLCHVLKNISETCPVSLYSDRSASYVDVLGRCIEVNKIQDGMVIIPDYVNIWHYLAHDLIISLDAIACSVLVGISVSVITSIFLAKFPKVAFPMCLITSFLTCFICAVYHIFRLSLSTFKPSSISTNISNLANNEFIIGTFCVLLTSGSSAICVAGALMHYKNARYAKGLLVEASKCLRFLPKLFSQPLWTLFSSSVFVFYFAILSIHVTNCHNGSSVAGLSVKYSPLLAANFAVAIAACSAIIFVWGISVLITGQQAIVAGAVREWYFCKNKSRLRHPITKSFFHLLKYNIGSIVWCGLGGTAQHYILILLARLGGRQSNETKNFSKKQTDPDDMCCTDCSWITYFSPYSAITIGIYGYVKPTCLCSTYTPEQENAPHALLSFVKTAKKSLHSLKFESGGLFSTIRKSAGAARWCFRVCRIAYLSLSVTIYVLTSETKLLYVKACPLLVTVLLSDFSCKVCLGVFSTVSDTLSECLHADLLCSEGKDKIVYGSRDLIYHLTGYKLLETATHSGLLRLQKRKFRAEKQQQKVAENRLREAEARERRRNAARKKNRSLFWNQESNIFNSSKAFPVFPSYAEKAKVTEYRFDSIGSTFSSVDWKKREGKKEHNTELSEEKNTDKQPTFLNIPQASLTSNAVSCELGIDGSNGKSRNKTITEQRNGNVRDAKLTENDQASPRTKELWDRIKYATQRKSKVFKKRRHIVQPVPRDPAQVSEAAATNLTHFEDILWYDDTW